MKKDPAKARFFVIQAMRWSGLAFFAVGLLVLYGRIALPEAAGYTLAVVGIFEALVMPTLLARRWKSPPS